MKKLALIIAFTLTGCILDHDRETRPGKHTIIDCRDRQGWPPEPIYPGADSTISCTREGL